METKRILKQDALDQIIDQVLTLIVSNRFTTWRLYRRFYVKRFP